MPRLGRRSPLGPRQRERLWSVFGPVAAGLREQGIFTRCGVCRGVAAHYDGRERKPFDQIVVDEAQDLGPAELSFLAAIAPPGEDALFFAGDIGQRIFQHPFSWKALGIDVRGRSSTLKVCYRTSRQIRSVADRLLPGALRDPDGNEEERAGTISVFDGPVPVIAVVADAGQEVERVADFLRSAIADGIEPTEIGVFVRSPEVIGRARAASEALGPADRVTVSVMHLAKGLEFRAVAVMACDQDVCRWNPASPKRPTKGNSMTSMRRSDSCCTSPAPEPATACWCGRGTRFGIPEGPMMRAFSVGIVVIHAEPHDFPYSNMVKAQPTNPHGGTNGSWSFAA